MLLKQVAELYRSKLRNDLPGADGDEVARKRLEDYANRIRPSGFLVVILGIYSNPLLSLIIGIGSY